MSAAARGTLSEPIYEPRRTTAVPEQHLGDPVAPRAPRRAARRRAGWRAGRQISGGGGHGVRRWRGQ